MEKIDLVYILGDGSKWANNEIRYSLRSVEKHFKNAGKVFIVGKCPGFINKAEAEHIPCDDPFNHKLKNAIWKIRMACLTKKIGDPFLLMNDDFFFMRRTFDIQTYHKGLLETAEKRHETHGGYYYKAIKNTLEILDEFGMEKPMNYDVHYPLVLEKAKFKKATDQIDFGVVGYLFRSFYGNYYKIGGKYRKDVKVYSWAEKKSLESMDFLSIDNAVAKDLKFQKWIDRKFPDRSKYEKAPVNGWYVGKLITFGGRTYNPGDIITGNVPDKIVKENGMRRVLNIQQ